MLRNSQPASAATPAVASMKTHCSLDGRNTRARTHGIRMMPVRTRFMPKVRIHCRGSSQIIQASSFVLALAASEQLSRRDPDPLRLCVGLTCAITEAAVATFPALKVSDGFEQMDAAEIRPQPLGDKDLGVGDLPQQIVGNSHLSGGPDQQVGVGHVGSVEMTVNILFRDAAGAHAG